jgi:ABC-type polysaccharide/polyol phosphate export permease
MFTILRELLTYRALVQSLVVRELRARYRGSVLGFLWTFLNPLLLMATYALVFSVYIRIGMEKYTAFLLTGLLPWIWFSSSLLMGATSIVDGGGLIKKVFFPPQVLPTVTVVANTINFLLSLPFLLLFLLLFRVPVGWAVVALLPVMAVQFVFTLGLVLIVSALTVRYRDLSQLLANLLTLWFFLSPVIYPASQVPEQFRFTLSLNPIAPLVVAYQDILFYGNAPRWGELGAAVAVSVVILAVGTFTFDRFRYSFAEEV